MRCKCCDRENSTNQYEDDPLSFYCNTCFYSIEVATGREWGEDEIEEMYIGDEYYEYTGKM